MRYKTFRNVLWGGVVVALAGGGVLLVRGGSHSKPEGVKTPAVVATPDLATATAGTASMDASVPGRPALVPAGASLSRKMDRDVQSALGAGLEGNKVKDLFPERPYKVAFHKDAGHVRYNRVKIDLNRNGKWDERWTVGDGKPPEILREVAPADDENYTTRYQWKDNGWVLK